MYVLYKKMEGVPIFLQVKKHIFHTSMETKNLEINRTGRIRILYTL